MTTLTVATEVAATAKMHLDLLDQFAATVVARLNSVQSDYARESLAEMLDTIAEQRETYLTLLASAEQLPLAA